MNNETTLRRLPCDKCDEHFMEEMTNDEYSRYKLGEFKVYCSDCAQSTICNSSPELELRKTLNKFIEAQNTGPNWPKLGCFFVLLVCPWGFGVLMAGYAVAKFFWDAK